MNVHSGIVIIRKSRNQVASDGVNNMQYSCTIEYNLTIKCKLPANLETVCWVMKKRKILNNMTSFIPNIQNKKT